MQDKEGGVKVSEMEKLRDAETLKTGGRGGRDGGGSCSTAGLVSQGGGLCSYSEADILVAHN